MTMRVSWGIYRQAAALRRRGVPFHHHPDRPETRSTGEPTGRHVARPVPPALASHIRGGSLTVVDDKGTHRYGRECREATMVIHDRSVYSAVLLRGVGRVRPDVCGRTLGLR